MCLLRAWESNPILSAYEAGDLTACPVRNIKYIENALQRPKGKPSRILVEFQTNFIYKLLTHR
jgi:hypothetical protein